jgi:DNA-binding transcriptional LysR family regulator
MKVRGLKPAGYLRFSHYDQVIAAAISGAGIAIGRWPHLASHLRQKVLVAPMGDAGVARLGRFHLVVRGGATPGPVEAFLSWLRAEAEEDTKKRAKATSTRRPSARRAGARAAGSRR